MSVYYYFAEDGLYLGVDVKDQNLIYRDNFHWFYYKKML